MRRKASMPSWPSASRSGRAAERRYDHPLSRCSMLLARHLAEPEFLDLSRGGLGDFGEHDVTRTLEGRQMASAPRNDVLLRGRFAGLQLHEGARGFTPFLVRHRNHR